MEKLNARASEVIQFFAFQYTRYQYLNLIYTIHLILPLLCAFFDSFFACFSSIPLIDTCSSSPSSFSTHIYAYFAVLFAVVAIFSLLFVKLY